MPQLLLDSHIHLWPASAANSTSHTWMQEGAHLTKQYATNDYISATSASTNALKVAGYVYVETDRTVTKDGDDVRIWAAEPLKEIAFLRRLVEGEAHDDGLETQAFDPANRDLLKGIVAWAPLDRALPDFLAYMAEAKHVAGEETWSKIKGFRFLLQGIKVEGTFAATLDANVSSFVDLLRFLGARGLSFDVGLDQRQGGVWQLERFADTIEEVHRTVVSKDKTIFILNHMCKPDMTQPADSSSEDFFNWKIHISRMAKHEKVFMKLSGAFSEMAQQSAEQPLNVEQIAQNIQPWVDHVFQEFGPWRIMFGSDWPVCNVGGPGDARSWSLWVDVVDYILHSKKLSQIEMDRVWYSTAVEAYRLEDVR